MPERPAVQGMAIGHNDGVVLVRGKLGPAADWKHAADFVSLLTASTCADPPRSMKSNPALSRRDRALGLGWGLDAHRSPRPISSQVQPWQSRE